MERLAEQPKHEQLQSFNPLASVDMLRFDIGRFGQVLPETRQRVCDEELSYVTEGIDRAFRSSFCLRREGNDILYFSEGAWQPYTAMLLTGLKVAEQEARADPRKEFLKRRAIDDLQRGYQLRSLQPGQKMIWYSRYPQHEADLHGMQFMDGCGFQSSRRMGFMYHACCQADGSIVLESQTVDRSDDDAFAAVMRATSYDSELDLDGAVRTYDGILAAKHGGQFFAGRRDTEIGENIWQTVLQQQDLINAHLNQLEVIAANHSLSRPALERQAKEQVIGFWAALKKRIDGHAPPYQGFSEGTYYDYHNPSAHLILEMQTALQEVKVRREPLIGCGGKISLETDIVNDSLETVFKSIFGTSSSQERYGYDKKMYCVVCQAPPKKEQPKKWCGPCGICKLCDIKIQAKNAIPSLSN